MERLGFLDSGQKVSYIKPEKGEEVVITGISGKFPDSHNVYHFRDNLFNKVDLVSDDARRWKPIHPEVPQRTGKLFDIEKFDRGFFGVTKLQSDNMDPSIRLTLERVYEAIVDAGYNLDDFVGTNTAIIVGSCFSETEKFAFYDVQTPFIDSITGAQRSMQAKYISYYLKLKGTAYTSDTACSSSLFALQEAYIKLREGKCDKAIIIGTNLCVHPIVSLQFARLGVLSRDGSCKSFDDAGNGYARSEGVVVALIEKAKDAKRIYAEVLHSKTNCDGHKKEGITFPSSESQKILMKEFYDEIQIDPTTLTFIEAHGTGTQVGDPEELSTLDEVFCKGRNRPLLIGAIKSNIGHNEPASGLSSVVKVVIGMETGFIPPNINYKKARAGVEALEKARMIVVTEKTPLPDNRGLFGVNSFGFGGGNAHILLHWNTKIKVNKGIPADNLPRLICINGRVRESVSAILDDVRDRPLDAEYVYLIHQAFRNPVENNLYRGFGIFTKQGEVKRSMMKMNIESPKLYFVFSNCKEEWLKLGNRLQELPIFANTIKSIQETLYQVADVDFNEIIKNSKDDDNLMYQILETVAIQISLANVLKSIKLVPDRIVGIGSGELVAAYVDNYLTLKQAVLGLCFLSSCLSKDKHKNWEALEKILPNKMNSYEKWIPTHEEKLGQSSAEYFLNNITSSTNGRDVRKLIPKEAVSVVIGSHITEVPGKMIHLIHEKSSDPVLDLLSNLGSLFEYGCDMELNQLYPSIELPVSRGTPMLSPLVKWHSHDCNVYLYKNEAEVRSGYRVIHIVPKTDDWNFIVGHVIDGRNLFPATAYLSLAWECYAMTVGKLFSEVKIVFEDVKFIRAVNIPKDGGLELIVMVQTGTNTFEITDGGVVVAKGKIYEKTDEQILIDIPNKKFEESNLCMTEKDVYKELKLRGYHYSGLFKGIKKSTENSSQAIFQWNNNWVAFMDCFLQLALLQGDTRNIYIPTSIGQLVVDAPKHINSCERLNGMMPVRLYRELNVIRSEGIEMRGLAASIIARKKSGDPVLEVSKFIANEDHRDVVESVMIFSQIVLENSNVLKVKVVEVCGEEPEGHYLLCPIVQKTLDDLPSIQQDITLLTNKTAELPRISVQNKPLSTESNCLIVIVSELLETIEAAVVINVIKDAKGYIISRENLKTDLSKFHASPFKVICSHTNDKEMLVLLKLITIKSGNTSYMDLSNSLDNLQWVPKLQKQIKNHDKVVLYSQDEDINGLLGFCACLQRETSGGKICSFLIMDEAPKFDPDLEFYRKQLDKNMAMNVWKDGAWGTYRHLPLPDKQTVECEHIYANVTTRGDLSTLTWLEGNIKTDEYQATYNKELIYIYYAALNFRDLMTASGRIPPDAVTEDRIEQECVQGFEFAGRNSRGQRVMGMCSNGSLASMTLCDKRILYEIPDEWTMEEASTVTVVYGTVLHILGRLNPTPGQSILIHSATGGIGLAAINLSLHYGLKIFVTVGTPEKREYLLKCYPQIEEKHIGNSRDVSFETMIYKHTNGRGVDYVLNSLAEEKLLASVRCLARGGQFLEIGKFDLANNSALAMSLLEKDAQFIGMALDKDLLRYNFPIHIFNNEIHDLIRKGALKPLPRTVFKQAELEQAFRFMGVGKHIGKVVIKIRDEENHRIYPVPKTLFKATPRFFCNPSCSYVICGGLGGFGLELADLLVVRGAKNLILTSRSGLCNGYQKYRIRIWKSYGVNVLTTTLDASTEEGCSELLNAANELGPVDGIFNLAAVLKDVLFENHTVETFEASLSPKAHSTKNLDSISRKLCPNIRYFVVFSSISCGRGNTGQTNYGMANSVMERICEKRKREGYPALAIQWGAIGEVGLVAKMQDDHKELIIGGTLQQRISSCLQVMDNFLKQNEPIVGSMLVAEKRYGGRADNLFDAVLNILGVSNLKSVSMHSTFPELGMDSMMAVEVKQTLEREYEVFLTAQDIRGMTLSKLKDLSNVQEIEISTQNLPTEAALPEPVNLLLRYIGNEETSNVPVIKMKTLVEDNEDAPHIVVLPGIEGMASVLEPLCDRLKAHVSCLQFCSQNDSENIGRIAKSVLPYVEAITENLIILAYSFGCAVAVELLQILETNGKQARVIFVDGSPELLVRLAHLYFPAENENLFQIITISSMMLRYLPQEYVDKHKEQVMKLSTYKEKIDYMINLAPYNLDISKAYLKEMCISGYDRIKAIHKYEYKGGKLKSPVTLFKASASIITNVASDYYLSNIFENVEDIVTVEANHITILENEQLPKEINKIIGIC